MAPVFLSQAPAADSPFPNVRAALLAAAIVALSGVAKKWIDDGPTRRRQALLKKYMKKNGYTPHAIKTGVEALNLSEPASIPVKQPRVVVIRRYVSVVREGESVAAGEVAASANMQSEAPVVELDEQRRKRESAPPNLASRR